MRTVYPEIPPRVEYCVTDLGRTLKPTLDSLAHWMTEHREQLIQESTSSAESSLKMISASGSRTLTENDK